MRVARCALRVTGYELRVAGCALRVTGYGLRVTSCGLLVTSCALRGGSNRPRRRSRPRNRKS
jgi:hypothetical protein